MSDAKTLLPDLGRFWTVPNALSLGRLVLVAPITYLIWVDGSLGWLFGLVAVAAFTDWLDGRIARWTKSVSEWGKVVDPVADKVGAVMTVTALTFRAADPHLPLWFFALVIGRDVLILLGSSVILRRSGRIVMSAWAGKAASLWLALTVLAAVLKADLPVLNVCLWMTAGLLVFSFVIYLIRALNAVRRPPPSPVSDESSEASSSGEDAPTTQASSLHATL